MVKPLTQEHLRAFKIRNFTSEGLVLRAEYCDFMAETSVTEAGQKLWELSATRRRAEAVTRGQAQ